MRKRRLRLSPFQYLTARLGRTWSLMAGASHTRDPALPTAPREKAETEKFSENESWKRGGDPKEEKKEDRKESGRERSD